MKSLLKILSDEYAFLALIALFSFGMVSFFKHPVTNKSSASVPMPTSTLVPTFVVSGSPSPSPTLAPDTTLTPIISPTPNGSLSPSPTELPLAPRLIYGIGPISKGFFNPPKTAEWEDNLYQKIRSACGNVVRISLDWNQLEPNAPSGGNHNYLWANFDRKVDNANSRGIKILGLLTSAPPWASGIDDGSPHLHPPDNGHKADFIAYLTAVVNRYGNKIQYYEFWNEANDCSWQPGCGGDLDTRANEYLPWLKTTYDTIKSIDSNKLVSTTGMGSGNFAAYLNKLYEKSNSNNIKCSGSYCWDAVNIHPYPAGQNNGLIMFSEIDAVRQSMINHNEGNKPVWLGEYGWNRADDGEKVNSLRQSLETLETPQYDYITIAIYHTIADFPGAQFGLLDENLNKKLPSGGSYDEFTSKACNP